MVEFTNGKKWTKIEGGGLLESLFLQTGGHSIFQSYSILFCYLFFRSQDEQRNLYQIPIQVSSSLGLYFLQTIQHCFW